MTIDCVSFPYDYCTYFLIFYRFVSVLMLMLLLFLRHSFRIVVQWVFIFGARNTKIDIQKFRSNFCTLIIITGECTFFILCLDNLIRDLMPNTLIFALSFSSAYSQYDGNDFDFQTHITITHLTIHIAHNVFFFVYRVFLATQYEF